MQDLEIGDSGNWGQAPKNGIGRISSRKIKLGTIPIFFWGQSLIIFYSERMDLTGSQEAALKDWKLTVSSAITKVRTPAITNSSQWGLTL